MVLAYLLGINNHCQYWYFFNMPGINEKKKKKKKKSNSELPKLCEYFTVFNMTCNVIQMYFQI